MQVHDIMTPSVHIADPNALGGRRVRAGSVEGHLRARLTGTDVTSHKENFHGQ